MKAVKAWKENLVIPTYEVGEPEKYPIFLEKRVYQGSSGVVYPHPVIEKISHQKTDKEWEVVFIENDFIKIMVLPALGGRIQMAYDKIAQRHFVYYNEVIKPALVGLTGPWISGGIEFNWPQHHRPSTFDPTDCYIEENRDGSKTVWVNEVERMFRTKGMAGFTLYPDKAYLEVKAHLYNRTPHPQTFLWWANPAVAVNDHYYSVFPPDVNAVFDHGKRDVSRFPIAKGTYYKVDYSAGVDISRYKNIPVPTSYMAIKSDYDFVGGYEEDTQAGLLHVADHHISPGKKQWTWGNGHFGHAWDRNLTDHNGPYIEMMCGVYTDNQPDFSWIQPYEERSFKQYFMPYRNVGRVKNATKEALVNLDVVEGAASIKIHVTAGYPRSRVMLCCMEKVLLDKNIDLSPFNDCTLTATVGDITLQELEVSVQDHTGRELVCWQPKKPSLQPPPEPAKPAKAPKDITSTEQLYLTGMHLEQYRHATYNPKEYYQEALNREPGDVRNNNALGLYLLKKGKFNEAAHHFQKAIDTLTARNPNPYNGEPYFNLGVALKYQEKQDAAYDAFFKACWNTAWQDAGYFHLAQIDCQRSNYEKALELVEKSLVRNWLNHKARHLKVILLRKLNRKAEALQWIEESLQYDKFNFGVRYEKYFINQDLTIKTELKALSRDYVHNYVEYALDYSHAGLYEEANLVLRWYSDERSCVYPMVYYFMGNNCLMLDETEQAQYFFELASKMSPDHCFPNRLEEVVVLEKAIAWDPSDSKALYYLGNFWYANQQYHDALECWKKSVELDDTYPVVSRNLALVYYNKLHRKDEALEYLSKAFELDHSDARVLMELDQLHKKLNKDVKERLALLEENPSLVEQRDDLYLERVTLYNLLHEHEKALELIMGRKFQPWEGGEGKVPAQYLMAQVEIAKKAIVKSQYEKAISHLQQAKIYPHNLGEGKLFGAQENDIDYWLGCASELMGDSTSAQSHWEMAAKGLSDPSPAMFYNDQPPDKIFYQGLALKKLGRMDEAKGRFNRLIDYGEKHLFDEVKIDYFAVSLPDLLIWDEDLNIRNRNHCHYMIGLGELGLGKTKKAISAFDKALKNDRYQMGVFLHKELACDDELRKIESGKNSVARTV